MNRQEFLEVLKKSENSFHNDFSHKNGSDYYSFKNMCVRISDHAKPVGSFGYETYNQGNDFRTYDEALVYLSSMFDMSNKDLPREEFYKKNSVFLKKEGDNYRTPYGSLFSSIDSALNNWWRTRRDFCI